MSHTIDYLGTLLLAAGLSAIILAASLGGNTYAWGSPEIVGAGIAGVLLLLGFAAVERRAAEPVLPPHLFSNRTFVLTSAIGLVVGFALYGAVTYLPLFLQIVKGATPTGSGPAAAASHGGPADHLDRIRTGDHSHRALPLVPGRRDRHHDARPLPVVKVGPASSTATVFLFMFVLGLGLGMVMQVLILIVQNAVDYKDLGVATSGATLFRHRWIGRHSDHGRDLLGKTDERTDARFPGGRADGEAPSSADTRVSAKQIDALPAAVRGGYLHAYTNSLSTVFLVAAAVASLAFLLSLFIKELPLRDTVATRDMGDTFATPRSSESLAVIVNKIGELDRRRRRPRDRRARRGTSRRGTAAAGLLAARPAKR